MDTTKLQNFFDWIMQNKEALASIGAVITSVFVCFKTFPQMLIDGSIPDNLYVLKSYEQLYKHANFKRNKDCFIIAMTYILIAVAALLAGYNSPLLQTSDETTSTGSNTFSLIVFAIEFFGIIILLSLSALFAVLFPFLLSKKKKTSITSYDKYNRKLDSIHFMTISFAFMLTVFFAFSFSPLMKEFTIKNVLLSIAAMLIFIVLELVFYVILIDKNAETRHLAKGFYEKATSNGNQKRYIFYTESQEKEDAPVEIVCGDVADAEQITALFYDKLEDVKKEPVHIIPNKIYEQIKVYSYIKAEEDKLGDEVSKISVSKALNKSRKRFVLLEITDDSVKVKQFKKRSDKSVKKSAEKGLQDSNKKALDKGIAETESGITPEVAKITRAKLDEILNKMCHEVLTKEEKEILDSYYYNLVKHVTKEIPAKAAEEEDHSSTETPDAM